MYHCHVKALSRSDGQNVPQTAAYITGQPIKYLVTGETFYRHKGGVVDHGLLLPQEAPEWAADISELLSAAEVLEVQKNARVAREVEVAIPWPLSMPAGLALVKRFGSLLQSRYCVPVIWGRHCDSMVRWNGVKKLRQCHHSHLLFLTRELTAHGLGPKIALNLSDAQRRTIGLAPGWQEIKVIRKAWEVCANQALEQEGHELRLDCRSFKERGLKLQPSIHVGPKATRAARAGQSSERGDVNLEIFARRLLSYQSEAFDDYQTEDAEPPAP